MLSNEYLQILRFALVGIWNTFFDLSMFWVFINAINKLKGVEKLPLRPATLAHIGSFLIANFVSYQLNSRFTFTASSQNRGFLPYFLVTLVSLGISSMLIQYFSKDTYYQAFKTKIFKPLQARITLIHKMVLGQNKYAAFLKLVMVGVVMTVNYLGYKYFVFG